MKNDTCFLNGMPVTLFSYFKENHGIVSAVTVVINQKSVNIVIGILLYLIMGIIDHKSRWIM